MSNVLKMSRLNYIFFAVFCMSRWYKSFGVIRTLAKKPAKKTCLDRFADKSFTYEPNMNFLETIGSSFFEKERVAGKNGDNEYSPPRLCVLYYT